MPGARRPEIHLQLAAAPHHRFARNDEDHPFPSQTETRCVIMAKDINKTVFTEETKLKLDIFRECFREWYPVFLHNQHTKRLYIYDMFAGSGKDVIGNLGSPLILLQEAIGEGQQHCEYLRKNQAPTVLFGFNEKDPKKMAELQCHVENEIAECKNSCHYGNCVFEKSFFYQHDDFQTLIKNPRLQRVLSNRQYGKFILLDQYGFKQITDEIFLQLVNAPKTDFIFFIASSFIKRFQQLPAVTAYFRKENISFDETKPKECHRVITNYFRGLLPSYKEYYLHSFTIQKGKNYYGLIFGSNHSLGMEKFLRVCWRQDPFAGESNCNINNDYQIDELFHIPGVSNKKQTVSDQIKQLILNKEIRSNIEGLKYALQHGCEPKVYVDVIDKLIKYHIVMIDGVFNRTAANIHNAKPYNIVNI